MQSEKMLKEQTGKDDSMSAKVSVIIKQLGRVPYKTAISPRLENLQATVGGVH